MKKNISPASWYNAGYLIKWRFFQGFFLIISGLFP
jgi:hypothetical protein